MSTRIKRYVVPCRVHTQGNYDKDEFKPYEFIQTKWDKQSVDTIDIVDPEPADKSECFDKYTHKHHQALKKLFADDEYAGITATMPLCHNQQCDARGILQRAKNTSYYSVDELTIAQESDPMYIKGDNL